MKYILTLIITLVTSISSYAQNGINYKAQIKDDLGNVVANQPIIVQFSILQNATTVYQETHSPTTDDNGIIIVNIGEGTDVSGVFDDINWSADSHFLTVEIDTGSGLVNLGTTQFMAVPYALNAANISGLEAIDEGNGVGWRLVGRNPDNYGNVGLDAVDLSYNLTTSTVRGATGAYAMAMGSLTEASGTYATAFGRNTIASEFSSTSMGSNTTASGIASTAMGSFSEADGDYSTAMGSQSFATGDYSTALGSQTTASGSYATAMGRNTTAVSYATAMGSQTNASASYSTAMGRQTTASGNNATAFGRSTTASALNATAMGEETEASGGSSTAMGSNTRASGNFSTAMGFNTIASGGYSTATGHYSTAAGFISTAMGNRTTAPSFAETVVGTYNTTYTPNAALTWNSNDRLFVIGNGQFGARSNAMVVLKNGNIGVGTSTPQELLHISGGRLRIGSETIEDTGSNQLSFNASLLPDIDDAMNLGNSNFRWNAVWAADGTINTSDRREKKNIETLTYGLQEVLQMKPVRFNWKNKHNPDLKLGLIAQDVQALIPEVVKSHAYEIDEVSGKLIKTPLNRLGVYYSDLIPVLINAIQEQQKMIDHQKRIIAKLGKTTSQQSQVLEALLSRVEALENSKKRLNIKP